MADITASIGIWDIRAGEITLTPNEDLLRLDLGDDVRIITGGRSGRAAEEAAAMRQLARLAAEAAGILESRAADPR